MSIGVILGATDWRFFQRFATVATVIPRLSVLFSASVQRDALMYCESYIVSLMFENTR